LACGSSPHTHASRGAQQENEALQERLERLERDRDACRDEIVRLTNRKLKVRRGRCRPSRAQHQSARGCACSQL
jgi:hypothetical protein